MEDVPVEMLAIGDVVLVEPRTGTRSIPARVIALKAAWDGQTKHLVGWLVTVVGRRQLWLRRGERISRRCQRAVRARAGGERCCESPCSPS